MSLDWDFSGSDELGFSTMTDIGKIGAVMFHIVTGQECKFDIWDQGELTNVRLLSTELIINSQLSPPEVQNPRG
jgi:hypothetical protein